MYFEEIVGRISCKLKGITHKLNGRFTFFNEDDLYQEALAHLWTDYSAGKFKDKTDSYILHGCWFFLKNYIRTAYTNIDSKSVSMEKPVNENKDSLADAMFLRSRQEEYSLLQAGVLYRDIAAWLTTQERKVLDFYIEGLTTRAIGSMIGVSHVSIVKMVNNIRRKCTVLKKEVI